MRWTYSIACFLLELRVDGDKSLHIVVQPCGLAAEPVARYHGEIDGHSDIARDELLLLEV